MRKIIILYQIPIFDKHVKNIYCINIDHYVGTLSDILVTELRYHTSKIRVKTNEKTRFPRTLKITYPKIKLDCKNNQNDKNTQH